MKPNILSRLGLNGATETVSLWMNLESSTKRSSVSNENDYYEYLNHGTNNKSDDDRTNVSTSLPIVSTEATILQPIKTIQSSDSTKYIGAKNVTASQIKKNSSIIIPPSPSSSGFTFFGVPLPNLNFNFWGNTGRKAERKEISGGIRPGRGRYRVFPPTEPEIHRGGFVPLPRGQGGFVPIIDPSRLVYDQGRTKNDRPKDNLDQDTNYIRVQEQRNSKHSNNTTFKLERNLSRTNKSRSSSKNKDEVFTTNVIGSSKSSSNNLTENNRYTLRQRYFLICIVVYNFNICFFFFFFYRPYSLSNLTKIIKSPSSLASNETSSKTNETSLRTEFDQGDKLLMNMKERKAINDSLMEIASKIVWTTPKTDYVRMTYPSDKAIATTIIDDNRDNSNDFDVKMTKGKNYFWNSETMEAQKIDTTMTMINSQNEATGKIFRYYTNAS